jgi:hypothetical protein
VLRNTRPQSTSCDAKPGPLRIPLSQNWAPSTTQPSPPAAAGQFHQGFVPRGALQLSHSTRLDGAEGALQAQAQNTQNHSRDHCAPFFVHVAAKKVTMTRPHIIRAGMCCLPPFLHLACPWICAPSWLGSLSPAVAHAPPLPSSRRSGSASPLCPVRAVLHQT